MKSINSVLFPVLIIGLMLVMGCGDDVTEVEDATASTETPVKEFVGKSDSTSINKTIPLTPGLTPDPSPIPTLTPDPTITPTPTQTPVPLSAITILQKSSEVMSQLQSLYYEEQSIYRAGQFERVVEVLSEFQNPDILKQTVSVNMPGVSTNTQYLKIGDSYFESETPNDWVSTQVYRWDDFRYNWTQKDGVLNLPVKSTAVTETLAENQVYRIVWEYSDISLSDNDSMVIDKVRSFNTFDKETRIADYRIEYWIDINSFFLLVFLFLVVSLSSPVTASMIYVFRSLHHEV